MFMCALRASLLLLLATRSALAQTSETAKDATGQDSTQQPLQQRPQVFFPTAEQPKMEMHHHGNIHEVMPKFPRLGNSQRVVSGSILLLEELEQMAIAHNPTLAQTRRAIEARGAANFRGGCIRTLSLAIVAMRYAVALSGAANKDFLSSNQSFLAGNWV
jgi:hypothetical protein